MQAQRTPVERGSAPTKIRLRRLPRDEDGQPRYLHPYGYVIVRYRRSWSERGREPGRTGHDPAPPLYWWEVYEHVSSSADLDRFHPQAHKGRTRAAAETLREARAWCDERPRRGWVA